MFGSSQNVHIFLCSWSIIFLCAYKHVHPTACITLSLVSHAQWSGCSYYCIRANADDWPTHGSRYSGSFSLWQLRMMMPSLLGLMTIHHGGLNLMMKIMMPHVYTELQHRVWYSFKVIFLPVEQLKLGTSVNSVWCISMSPGLIFAINIKR